MHLGRLRAALDLAHRMLARGLPAALIACIGLAGSLSTASEAKAPGVSHCYRGVCHRVRTIEETSRLIGRTLVVQASHYDHPRYDRFNTGKFTSNGEIFDASDPARVASSDLPDGTELLLRNPANGRVSHVRVNDFGPFRGNRLLDVTRRVADDLGFSLRGVAEIEVIVIAPPQAEDLRYRRNRPRFPALGHLGYIAQAEMARVVDAMVAERNRPLGFETADAEAAEFETAALETPGETPGSLAGPEAQRGAVVEVAAIDIAAADAPAEPPADPVHAASDAEAPAIDIAAAMQLETSHSVSPAAPPPTVPTAGHHDVAPPSIAPRGDDDIVVAVLEHSALNTATVADAVMAFVPQALPQSDRAGTPSIQAAAGPSSPPVRTNTGWTATGRHGLLLLLIALLTSALLALATEGRITPRLPATQSRASRSRHLRSLPPVETPEARSIAPQAPEPVVPHAAAAAGSLLSAGIEIEGALRTSGRLSIAGIVRGRIEAQYIVILPGGRVEGTIEAVSVEIAGSFTGQIAATALVIGATGHITGEITCGAITVAEGAFVDADFRPSRQPPI